MWITIFSYFFFWLFLVFFYNFLVLYLRGWKLNFMLLNLSQLIMTHKLSRKCEFQILYKFLKLIFENFHFIGIWSKIEIFVKNRHFCHKSKFLSNIKILAKKINFDFEKCFCDNFLTNFRRNFRKNFSWKFRLKILIFGQNRLFEIKFFDQNIFDQNFN